MQMLNQPFFHPDATNLDILSADRIAILGFLLGLGNEKEKALALFMLIQDESAEKVAASDKDLYPVF